MDRRTGQMKMERPPMETIMIMNSFGLRIGWIQYHHHHDQHRNHLLWLREVGIKHLHLNHFTPLHSIYCTFCHSIAGYSPNKYTGTLGAHFDMDGVPFVLNPAISFDQAAQFDVSETELNH